MKTAVVDPVEFQNDQTIISVVLLRFFEGVTCTEESLTSLGQHTDGAVALLRHRGNDINETLFGAKLFYLVRSQMIINQITRCLPIDELSHTSGGWKGLPQDRQNHNVFSRLAIILMQIPALRVTAAKILLGPMDMTQATEVANLLYEAQGVDRELVSWTYSVSDELRGTVLGRVLKMDDADADPYCPSLLYGCRDVRSVNVWNMYRIYRIFCRKTTLKWIENLITLSERAEYPRYTSTIAILQQLVGSICYSVPFLLGLPASLYTSNASVIPNAGTKSSRDDHYKPSPQPDSMGRNTNTIAVGGFFLAWQRFVASSVTSISHTQRQWMNNRLRNINNYDRIMRAQVLVDRGSRTHSLYRTLDRNRNSTISDFAPLHDLQ